jgi:hypothetical protein
VAAVTLQEGAQGCVTIVVPSSIRHDIAVQKTFLEILL